MPQRKPSGRTKAKTVKVKIQRDGAMCFVPVPFDPRAAFGRVRVPVKVTLNGYSYRSTIFSMGGGMCIPLRRSHREAAGLAGGESLSVTIALDSTTRDVKLPADFARALKAARVAADRWKMLSYTHRREHVESIESAKKPETRVRRIGNAIRALEDHR